MCDDKDIEENEEKEVFKCDNCGEEFNLKSDLTECYNCGEYFCDDCIDKCYDCGKCFCDDCLKECEACDHKLCSNCQNECNQCGEVHCSDCLSECNGCGNSVCSRCLGRCSDCGDYYCSDCLNYCDECDNHHCNECKCDCHEDVDLHSYHRYPEIKNYTAKAEWEFVKQPWENTTFLGIELEISFPHDNKDSFFKVTKEKLNGLCFWKHDGSIDETEEAIGPGGELVVTPHTYQSHRKLNWKEILEAFSGAGGISYDAKSCGIHIHTNRDNLTKRDMDKLRAFFVMHYPFILKFSRRTPSHLKNYAFIPDVDQLERWNKNPLCMDRHVCLNLTEDTLEFRIFRGTLNPTRFRACLQFVDAMINFVKTHSYAACKGTNAVKYFKEHNKGRYALLNKYIESIGY
jgi:hypothetical protein